jgi:L-serine dehydratase
MSPFYGVFDLFRVGLGPSSSHTVGPMRAARAFVLGALPCAGEAARVAVTLYGSLAWTGRGHGTDLAVLAGLAGMEPATADADALAALAGAVRASGVLPVPGLGRLAFLPERDLIFDRGTRVAAHPNALRFVLRDAAGATLREELWFSVGGGFVVRENAPPPAPAEASVPYPFACARELLAQSARHGLSIAALQFANECARHPAAAVRAHLTAVTAAMEACIERGLAAVGELPGGLRVKRRAHALAERLQQAGGGGLHAPTAAIDHAILWAIAVNEENAAGGRVVTAPTNGAAGVLPAVLRYWRRYHAATAEGGESFLLTAAAVGALAKLNASISGAEVGCQGEVGVACAMAAAGLTAALGGIPAQVENAAEIGLEHHLGMTCDPIGGLVQIPCIERNAMGAVKAISAASLALFGDGSHRVSLDDAIATMRATGLDMRSEYKETALGGLAVHVTEC